MTTDHAYPTAAEAADYLRRQLRVAREIRDGYTSTIPKVRDASDREIAVLEHTIRILDTLTEPPHTPARVTRMPGGDWVRSPIGDGAA